MGEEQREEHTAGERAQALREDLAPAKLNAKLEEVVEERPKTRYVLDFKIVGAALLAAVVVALLLMVLVSAPVAALGLVVVFFGGWLIGAQVSYDRRRETRDVREDDEGDSGRAEEEDSPPRQAEARQPESDEYEGDRGEQEAEQEQEKDEEGASSPH